MNSLTLISLIVIVASMVNCEESYSSLYSRRAPNHLTGYQSRNLHGQIVPNVQDHFQAQQMRNIQAIHPAQGPQIVHVGPPQPVQPAPGQPGQVDPQKIDLIVRRYADSATQLVSHWARAMKERMIDQAAQESQSA